MDVEWHVAEAHRKPLREQLRRCSQSLERAHALILTVAVDQAHERLAGERTSSDRRLEPAHDGPRRLAGVAGVLHYLRNRVYVIVA